MGFLDKIRDMVSVSDDDYDEEDEISSRSENYDGEDEQPTRQQSERSGRRNSSKNQQPADTGAKNPSQMQVVLVKPERFEEAPGIADHLNFKRTVVLNLEVASKETSRRLLDFLSGAAYIKNGDIKRVASNTYIITPCNVDVSGELMPDDVDTSGLYF